MKFNKIYQFFIQLHCIASVICENYYTVVAPGVIKSNRKYTAAVTWHSSDEPCTVRISISGRSFNASDEVQLQPFETKSIDFFPPKLVRDDYQLLAEGLNGCLFTNQSKLLTHDNAGPKIYIQTDKAVYKPLDLVQFRVVILDEHTRPVDIQEPIRIEILDNDKNRVKQFKDIKLTKGVFTEKFKLSQQPVMGDWEIKAIISGKYSHERSKRISVRLYTLPKFSVYVDTPENFVLADGHIRAEVYGKYTFDKYVEGSLLVELRKNSNKDLIDQKTLPVDGLAVIEFQVENPQKLKNEEFLNLIASLEEKHTGIRRNKTQLLRVRTERYRIEIPDEEIEFRDFKPFRLKARIDDWNNGPVWDTNTPVILEHGKKSFETSLNDEGVAVFEFDHEKDGAFTVFFNDSKQFLPNIYTYQETKETVYCKLKLKGRPRLGKPVEVEVRSSFNIPYLVYTVVGHASIVRLEHVKLPGNKKFHTIKITPSIEMIPESFLYVHYILDGNFRYEELSLRFPMELENQISIAAPKQVKPGQVVTLKLQAEPKSYVSILAVDISVFLLDSSYDIYKKTILEDLDMDRSYVSDSNIGRPGILSGLITLTNAHYPIYDYNPTSVLGYHPGVLDFRTKFPETWIFKNYEMYECRMSYIVQIVYKLFVYFWDYSLALKREIPLVSADFPQNFDFFNIILFRINKTDTEIVLNIPETITTWRITVFSNHAVKGFGIVDGPTDITTFLPFFITLNLPHSVKRDEEVAIPVTIFNYHNETLDTEVTLFNKNMAFRFIEPPSKSTPEDLQTKNTQIPANRGKTIKFIIQPIQVGDIELRLAANNSLYSDGVVHKLKVLAEGITKYKNNARYLSAADEKSSLSLDIPLDSVSDSELITLSVGGDFMIPSLENLNEMLKMPTGCGEQNMANFASNVLILDYLKAFGKLSKEKLLVNDARFNIEIGYQQELSYRHKNGGYSVFGATKNEVASTWLTAYVVRFFIKASKYTPIETRIIDSALEYLANEQWFDGRFPNTGYLFFNELQNNYGFSAFVLLAFMEDRKTARKYQTTIRKGLEYISSNLDDSNDVYALSIIAAALSKAGHASADKAIEKLQGLRKEDENGLMWWSGDGNEVETTAYVLMALLNAPGNHLPILKWLIEQRNKQGGFKTTQETVVGLEALTKFSQKYKNASNWNLRILYSAQDHEGNETKINEFVINKNNALVLQQHELPKSVRRVNFEIAGNGYSLVQLSSQYNVKKDDELKYFIMKVNPTIFNQEELELEVCFTYHALKGIHNSTNMVIMEANLPSGFKTEAQFNRDLLENNFIQRLESKNDETTTILYFDKLSTDVRHCVNIEAYKANEVMDPKPAAIVMYDYYNTERLNSQFYTIS